MSKLKDILDAVVAKETAVAATFNATLLPVVKRKLPKKGESLDPAAQVTVSGAENVDRVTRIGFGGLYSVEYEIDITLITPNDHDGLQNLDTHADWREAVRARYMKPSPLSAVAEVRKVDVVRTPFLDRGKLKLGFDYNQVRLNILTFETRNI